ncbi:hypothetical protein BHAOGJBA_6049 [Methylobacterium hispanicum]|uniref:Uncharacterized protein n=1 Tax=Methylobacterium hispanicum TaxID=270350 RepID=A0AAV4ZVF0_9HYPH|nr:MULTISPECIES: hypothetical protein [Methylobacterium]GJD92495.1 hypothetical protein BHAOGJBA_6049 [Methylobacterium hispanicum]
MTTPWLDGLCATLTTYTASAIAAGEAAGAGLAGQLAGALARVQALPDETIGAVAELNAALAALFPADLTAHAVPPSPAESLAPPGGQAHAIGGASAPCPLRRRHTVDATGLAHFLRARHPVKTAEHAAALTRLPVDTVAAILRRESLGNGTTLLAFVFAYGPEVLAAVVPDADERWLEGARILADQARLEAELARTRAEAAANAGRWSLCGIGFGGAA